MTRLGLRSTRALGEELGNPLVVLHEFYHHLRFMHGRHRGTERHADRYALEAIKALEDMLKSQQRRPLYSNRVE